jgi:hypothetical protein
MKNTAIQRCNPLLYVGRKQHKTGTSPEMHNESETSEGVLEAELAGLCVK